MNPRLRPDQITRLLQEAEQHLRAGRLADSEQRCRRVLETAPNNPLATHYLGAIAFGTGQRDIAIQLLKRATELDPKIGAYWGALGEALINTYRFREAVEAYRQVIALNPNDAQALYSFGALTGKLGLVDESIRALTRATELKPDLLGAINDLGTTLTSARRIDDALKQYRRVKEFNGDWRSARENLIYFMHFASGIDPMSIRAEAEAWGQRMIEVVAPPGSIPPHTNDRNPDRRLRIGYVSPDLYEHPVGRFMHTILAHHDHEKFEVFGYSDVGQPDAMTAELQGYCDHWRRTNDLGDDQLAKQIRDDRIDVLIDLSLHMGNNRLAVFARKPAPVQATYLGYAGTSGLATIDWRISDPHLDPPGNDRFYTERTYRLPRSYWCYDPPKVARSLNPGPLRDPSRPFTFACLNNIMKISDAALDAWAEVLKCVPSSQLIIQGEPGEHLEVMSRRIEAAGVGRERIAFAPKRSLAEYFQLYQRIDIALDAFPYAGGTTTCDALWMGVPVVTLAGQLAVHRGGVSILNNLGLSNLVTISPQEYINFAVLLAQDSERLIALRRDLRRIMQSSILMSPQAFVRDLENAWRHLWATHCST